MIVDIVIMFVNLHTIDGGLREPSIHYIIGEVVSGLRHIIATQMIGGQALYFPPTVVVITDRNGIIARTIQTIGTCARKQPMGICRRSNTRERNECQMLANTIGQEGNEIVVVVVTDCQQLRRVTAIEIARIAGVCHRVIINYHPHTRFIV